MTVPFVVASGRAMADRLMPDTGVLSRQSASGSLNATTGVWTPSTATVVYSGPMRVRPASTTEVDKMFGDAELSSSRYVLSLPFGTPPPMVDDRVVMDDNDEYPRTFRVSVVEVSAWRNRRRCGLELVE